MEKYHYNKKYKDTLKTVLDEFSDKSSCCQKDIENYIEAFSFYLSTGDDAYRYHPAFLVQKHQAFQQFLKKVRDKQKCLVKFVQELNKCEVVKQWRQNHPENESEIFFSMDDFVQCNLNEVISLCDEMSIEGAERDKRIVTVRFREQTASFFYPESEEEWERVTLIFLSIVADGNE